MNNVTYNLKIKRKSYVEISRILSRVSISDFINKIMINILGCELEAVGIKSNNYKPLIKVNREVIPIKLDKINLTQIKFYREELIPKVLDYFQ